MRAAVFGALVMPLAYLAGLQWGMTGLAFAWLVGFPLLPLAIYLQTRKLLGIDARGLAGALAPALLASIGMALVVMAFGQHMQAIPVWQRLLAEIAVGGAAYVLMLLVVSRDTLREVLSLIRQRAPNVAAPA